jgi:hypothetical protein
MGQANGRRQGRMALHEAKARAASERVVTPLAKRSHPNANGPHPVIDWNAAFAYYASLPANERSLAAVSRQMGVSEASVQKHARLDGWKSRVAAIEDQARQAVDRRAVRSLQERMETVIRLAEATQVTYAQQLQAGEVRVTPQDIVALAKLQQLLEGRPDARVEQLYADVANLSDEELEDELERMKSLDASG